MRTKRKPLDPPITELPLSRASWLLLAVLAAAVIALVVSYPLSDPDLWQHLLVGKVIWQTRQVPHTMLWVWPIYGQPAVLPSWLFRALLWPFWSAGGLVGLYAWRWLTTLAAFALLWAAARAAGARGPWVLPALVWCVLFYRERAQPRPDTLVAVLLAAQLFVLEKRRARGPRNDRLDPVWWLVPIALLWANAHISYYLGLMLTTFYVVDAAIPRRDRPSQRPLRLFAVLLACGAVSFANPFGWRALAQPFQYFFVWRHEAIYQSIGELKSVDWPMFATSLLPLWLGLLPVLALLRARRRGVDVAQWLCLLVLIPQAITTHRFLGYLAIVMAPSFARDFDEILGGWVRSGLASPRLRTAAIAASIVLLPLPSMANRAFVPGLGVLWQFYPVAACDWIEAHGVRGRALNNYPFGGYLLWRFWPQRDRLPFMDIHQDGTQADRDGVALLPYDEAAWLALERAHHFDWVLSSGNSDTTSHLLDYLDADPRYALVFSDDAAALYLRRDGVDSALASRSAYRWMPGGKVRIRQVGELAGRDSLAARAIRSELERQVLESRWNAGAHSLLANLDLMSGDWAGALGHLDSAKRVMPELRMLAEREQVARESLAVSRR